MRLLETERFLLKPVEESDLQELLELQWDKSLMKFMNFKPLSIENQKEWIKTLGKNNLAFSVFFKNEQKAELIGLATLNQIDHIHQRASWGLKLKSGIQGKGVGFEISLILLHFGFSNLNLRKIHGDSVSDNIGSLKMCDNIGLRQEGVLIDHYFQNGKFRNVTLVGILKEEFYSKNLEVLKNLGLLYE